MAFVYDQGGAIARFRNGGWVGTLDSPQALRGLTRLKSIVLAQSRASKTIDEANPQQALVFAKGKIASFIGNGWEWGYSLDPKLGNPKLAPVLGAYPMPSRTKGKYMPTFLGGSDLAVPVTSKNKSLAIDWIKAFTATGSMRELATTGKVIPEHHVARDDPQLEPAARAVRGGCEVELVRADVAELGERGERQRPPEHARVDLHRPLDGAGRGEEGESADHDHPERELMTPQPARATIAR